jgi:hypothetical protein
MSVWVVRVGGWAMKIYVAAAPAGQNVGPGSKRIDQRKCPDNSQADLSMIIDEMDRRPRHSRAEELMCDV